MSVPEGRLRCMADIALFHSVLGVRPGVAVAADRLRAAGHDVLVVDQYEGRVFDDYDEAGKFALAIGYPALMGRAAKAVQGLSDGFIAAGFSNGVPAQIHYTAEDPFRNQEAIDAVAGKVSAAGASIEVFDYPGKGHLFTDASLPVEYDEQATDLLWSRVLPFCAAPGR